MSDTPSTIDQTAALVERLRRMMEARDQGDIQRRDVHVKAHGLMRAEFTVAADLPPELRVGLFAKPATYRAWVRYSNSANEMKSDAKGDIIGMGIKLMGVPGAKLLDSEADARTHDFILITAPSFPSSTPGEFDKLVAAVIGSLWDKLMYFVTHPRVAWMLMTTMVKHTNVLQIPYFSAVPYAWGAPATTPTAPLAVKYVALPRGPLTDSVPFDPPGDYLRQAAKRQLQQGSAEFDFCVQFQRDDDCMPIEDPSRAWSLALSPPRRVASLRILQQAFDTPEIDAYGERLSYTPWHSLAEHRPLGEINRARRLIYEALSTLRHDKNHTPRVEPDDWEV
jgi:hypothetical protein